MTLFCIVFLVSLFSINRGGGGRGVSKIPLRNRGRGHIADVTDCYKGGGRAKFSPKTALRNV